MIPERLLEYRLGAVLFERTNGGTRPTLAGQEFLDTARRIVEETKAAAARFKSRSRGEAGRLTVGVHASLSAGNLNPKLTASHDGGRNQRQRWSRLETRRDPAC